MQKSKSPYRKAIQIFNLPFASCYIYHMVPGGLEEKHFHDGIELEYVIRGSSSTHKKGQIYFRKRGEIHEGINDSENDLVFLCVTIPAETKNNTHYL